MSDSPSPTPVSRHVPVRALAGLLALLALVAVVAIERHANRSAGKAVLAIEARMAGAGDGDVSTLPTRPEIETLINRQPADSPSTAPDGSLKVVYRWRGIFRSYEVRAYYSPGAVPRLVRYESQEATASTP